MRAEGKYRRLAVIGHGGMADVHLAVACGPFDFHKLLVLKELRPGLAQDHELRAMFQQEARVAARMAHPNVVQTHEIGSALGRPFIAMEFLDGQPLQRILRRVRRDTGAELPLALHLRVLVELLAGLHHAHTLCDYDGRPFELVHRDVTPHNVIVTHDGQVKLIDFGIARGLDPAGLGADTQVGTFKGKASYCAPEQARGERVDRRADLFAVGVMLWEALTQRRMWVDLDEVAIVQRLRAGEVPALSDGPHAGLRAVCRQALALDPRERHTNAAELAEAIEQHNAGPRASRRQLAAVVGQHFAGERAELATLIEAQMRRLREREADAPIVDMALLTGSDSHVLGAQAEPEEPTRPDGLCPRGRETAPADAPAPREEATESASGRGWDASSSGRQRGRLGLALGLAGLGLAGLGLATVDLGSRAPAADVPKDMSYGAGPEGQVVCGGADAPEVELSGDIEGDAVLRCDRRYRLSFVTHVRPGATLTIEPGTTIVGDAATRGTLVVQPGARLFAEGTPERPIVFTSAAAPGQQRPGDWGGLLLLGRAPTNLRGADGAPTTGRVEGLADAADHAGSYGGDDPDDSSGVLRFVRIEYSGVALGPNNEINGLTLAGVGRGTRIDHVQVRHSADDCFEFFGGTVDAHHLICDDPGDDGFDWDLGYTGRLQFLLLRGGAAGGDHGGHGLEGDNDPSGTAHTPVSAPQIYNATLCGRGRGEEHDLRGPARVGLLLRRGSEATVGNAVIAGFDAALDRRGGTLRLAGSLGFALPAGLAWAEPPAGTSDAPTDFTGKLHLVDRPLSDCGATGPAAALTADPTALTADPVAPPNDGFFDASARFVGAVRDRGDDWASAAWTRRD